ncbi:conjugal transfer protein TraX [Butyricicoccus faecihominis]|uniref:conjugal transfer protein TraX n=1 Tax=Butyricicoccus faecihominis TaxID=1712515 RepID=UPI00247AAF48|nr:conjugal transfer protein TraX [Butyricicoccus faecihominis]MCQ5128084.1 conjugal transfer protein TraX [Butyricicoccus faecihominis]
MELTQKKGINAFQLKLLALIIMTIDHIHYFGSSLWNVPEILTLIGRIAAPIFVFMLANGFGYTHSRGKYLLRLYIGATLMQLGNIVMNRLFPLQNNVIVINGIFSTMALIVFYLICIEGLRGAARTRQYGRMALCILGILAPIALSFALLPLLSAAPFAANALMIFVPLPLICEGGPLFVVLGIGFYYCRKSKLATGVFYTLYCIITLLLIGLTPENIQYIFFMWLSLPFILLYNGEKGRSMKYLFYIYYPAHVYILAIAASLLGSALA